VKKTLLCLAVIVILSVVIVPFSVSADGDKLLTPAEENFILQLASRMAQAQSLVASYREWVSEWSADRLLYFTMLSKGPKTIPFPAELMFEGCTLGHNVPDTMSDIASIWNDEVCNEFGHISQQMTSFSEGTNVIDLTAGLFMIRGALGRIESSISKIDTMAAHRADELTTMREAEQEAKKELDLDDECFIATAAYGTPTAKEIDELRRFRDEYLRKSSLGNMCIQYYYEKSPPIAKFISDRNVLRAVVREGFVEPVAGIIELSESWWAE